MSKQIDITALWEEDQDRRYDEAFHIGEPLPRGHAPTRKEEMDNKFLEAAKKIPMNKSFDPYEIAMDLKTSGEIFIIYLKKYCNNRKLELTGKYNGQHAGYRIVRKKGRARGTSRNVR